jgi:hypothetical protein
VVVARGVRGHEQGETADPGAAQQAIGAGLGRAGVEEDGGAVAVLDERRVSLADVEERDGEVVGRLRRSRSAVPAEREQRGGEADRRGAPGRSGSPPGRGGGLRVGVEARAG